MRKNIQTGQNKQEEKMYGLRYDTLFKNVFRDKSCLKQFMKEIFKEELESFWYLDKELPKENKNLRYRVSDLVIETEKRIMIIELQNKDLKNIEPRSKMYVSGFYTRQNPGELYKNVKPVELYLLLNYSYQTPDILKEYEEMNIKSREQFGNLSKIKIWNIYEAFNKKHGKDYDYARLFKLDKLGRLEEQKEILEKLKEKRNLQAFIRSIEIYNMDSKIYKQLKEEEEMEMSFEQATCMIEYYAEQRGEKRGEKIGEKRGEKRGIMTGKLETALSMLKEGLEIPLIKKITGLSEKQIQEYAKNK